MTKNTFNKKIGIEFVQSNLNQFYLPLNVNNMEAAKPKILLCEDDTNLGMVLKNYLELNDYDVVLERDGRLGLAAFQREKFDICLLDVMMPNMDGFAVAEEIRDINPDVPLFFLSAKTMKDDIIQDISWGQMTISPNLLTAMCCY